MSASKVEDATGDDNIDLKGEEEGEMTPYLYSHTTQMVQETNK